MPRFALAQHHLRNHDNAIVDAGLDGRFGAQCALLRSLRREQEGEMKKPGRQFRLNSLFIRI
jgi:hypothetical protein